VGKIVCEPGVSWLWALRPPAPLQDRRASILHFPRRSFALDQSGAPCSSRTGGLCRHNVTSGLRAGIILPVQSKRAHPERGVRCAVPFVLFAALMVLAVAVLFVVVVLLAGRWL
jgi:hypothetical protein